MQNTRKIAQNILFAFAIAVMLIACGGGDGSNNGDSPPAMSDGGNDGNQGNGDDQDNNDDNGDSNNDGQTPIAYTAEQLTQFLAGQLAEGYQELNDSVLALSQRADSFCAQTTDVSRFDALQMAWVAANSRWQYVQGINFGPVNEDSRRFRIAIYPNNPTRLDERISGLIAGDGELSQQTIAARSADLQGFTALERLLFRSDAYNMFIVESDVERHCLFTQAVVANLVSLISPVADAWQNNGDYYAIFTNENNIEQSLEDWFGSVAEHFQIIRDSKLAQVSVGNLSFIEAPLAMQSINNIEQNISFVHDAFSQVIPVSGDAPDRLEGISALLQAMDFAIEAQTFQSRIDASLLLFTNETRSLVDIVEQENSEQTIIDLSQGVQDSLEFFAVDVAEALGIFIGFNGADGD